MEKRTEQEFIRIWNIAYEHILKTPKIYNRISADLKSEMHLALLAIELEPDNYQFVPDILKNNPLVTKFALVLKPSNMFFVPNNLQNNEVMILECVEENPQIIMYISPNLIKNEFLEKLRAVNQESDFWIKKREIEYSKSMVNEIREQ